jgi:hypothetical protein
VSGVASGKIRLAVEGEPNRAAGLAGQHGGNRFEREFYQRSAPETRPSGRRALDFGFAVRKQAFERFLGVPAVAHRGGDPEGVVFPFRETAVAVEVAVARAGRPIGLLVDVVGFGESRFCIAEVGAVVVVDVLDVSGAFGESRVAVRVAELGVRLNERRVPADRLARVVDRFERIKLVLDCRQCRVDGRARLRGDRRDDVPVVTYPVAIALRQVSARDDCRYAVDGSGRLGLDGFDAGVGLL